MIRLRYILPVLVALLSPALASAIPNASAQGWCETGAQSVLTSGLASTTQVQASFPQCTVQVFLHGGGTATIFADAAGTALANPFTAQTNGHWQFYAANGRYDVTLSGAGFPSPVTYSDVFAVDLLFTPVAAHFFLGNNTGSAALPSYVQPGFTDLAGSLDCTQTPAFTGPITTAAGSCATVAAFLGFNNIFTGINTMPGLTLGALNTIRYVDGTTYPTIQSAINSLPRGGGMVVIPCGTYTQSSTLLFPALGLTTLAGCNMGAGSGQGGTRIVAASGSVTPLISIQGASAGVRTTNNFLRDLTIQGVYTAAQLCLNIDHATYTSLDHVQFANCGQAEWVNDSYRAIHYDTSYYQSGSGGANTTAMIRVENTSNPGIQSEQTWWTNSIFQGGSQQGAAVYFGPNENTGRISGSKIDYSGFAPNFCIVQLYQAYDTSIVDTTITSPSSVAPAQGLICMDGTVGTPTFNPSLQLNTDIVYGTTIPAIYMNFASFYQINDNAFFGAGSGNPAIVTTANTSVGAILHNRVNTSPDTVLNDVSGIAVACNSSNAANQLACTTPLSTNKAITTTDHLNTTLGLNDTSLATKVKRAYYTNGTALTSGNVALSGGWGTSPSFVISGYDGAFLVQVTSGTGSPTANPTVTVTFADGAWADGNPICPISRGDAVAPTTAYWIDVTSPTQLIATFAGTPGTSTVYTFNINCGGR